MIEIIGQSYFDYLAGLLDLVMIMDESHRYRASAGVRAINDLNEPKMRKELDDPVVLAKKDAAVK